MAWTARNPETFTPFKAGIVLTSGQQPGDHFWPEDTVSGNVFISTPTNLISRGFLVTLMGVSRVSFKEGLKCEEIFQETQVLSGDMKIFKPNPQATKEWAINGSKKMLKPGDYKWPFEFKFPKELPCTFTSPNGSISYQIVLYVCGQNKPVEKAIKTINFNMPTLKYLNDRSLAKPLIYKAGRSTFKMLFKLEKKLLIPHEDLSFTLEVYNCQRAQATISLIQRLDYKATLETKTVRKKMWTSSNDRIEGYWTGTLETPEMPPNHFGLAKSLGIMEVTYFIKLEVESIEGEKVNAVVPIKVGARMKVEQASSSGRVDVEREQIPPPDYTKGTLDVPRDSLPGNSLANSIPAYSDLSIYSTVSTLPPTYEEVKEDLKRLSI